MARMMTKSAAGMKAAAAAAWLALAATPVLADVKAGVDAWEAGDYVRAVGEWRGPAADGDADALFNLAQAYRLGRGVETDSARARQLYEEAARRGHLQAADNFGLMLFQEGEQDRAMPLIRAAAERGDPRAQYVLGLSHFNADYAPRDWVRAYALMTLAQSQGLPQAQDALAQMDRYIPTVQRSQAQSLARQLDGEARTRRNAELAAADLGSGENTPAAVAPKPAVMTNAAPAPAPAPVPVSAQPAVAARPAPAPAPRLGGKWQVQLGAFGVPGNAERLWNKLSGNPALAGSTKTLVPGSKLTRLLAGGFASKAAAEQACASLKRQGQACLVVGQG